MTVIELMLQGAQPISAVTSPQRGLERSPKRKQFSRKLFA